MWLLKNRQLLSNVVPFTMSETLQGTALSVRLFTDNTNTHIRLTLLHGATQTSPQIILSQVRIITIIMFKPIAVETLGVFNASARHLLADLGKGMSINTGEATETSYLFQKISVLVLMHDSLHGLTIVTTCVLLSQF